MCKDLLIHIEYTQTHLQALFLAGRPFYFFSIQVLIDLFLGVCAFAVVVRAVSGEVNAQQQAWKVRLAPSLHVTSWPSSF